MTLLTSDEIEAIQISTAPQQFPRGKREQYFRPIERVDGDALRVGNTESFHSGNQQTSPVLQEPFVHTAFVNKKQRPEKPLSFTVYDQKKPVFRYNTSSYDGETIFIDEHDPDFTNANVQALTLQLASLNPLSASFEVDAATAEMPAEAQLYARNPADIAEYLRTLPLDAHEIRRAIATPDYATDVSLPDALAFLSPPPAGSLQHGILTEYLISPSNLATIDNIHPANLFRAGVPADDAAEPIGFGSIKAIKLQWPGACTTELPYTSLFDITSALQLSPGSKLCTAADEFIADNVTVMPVMAGGASDRIQMFINLRAYGKKNIGNIPLDCTVRASALPTLRLGAPFMGPVTINGIDDGGVPRLGQTYSRLELPWLSGEGVPAIEFPLYDYPPMWKVDDTGGSGCSDISGRGLFPWDAALPYSQGGLRSLMEGFITGEVGAVTEGYNLFDQMNSKLAGIFALPQLNITPPDRNKGDISLIVSGFQRNAITDIVVIPDSKGVRFPPSFGIKGNIDACSSARRSFCNLIRLGMTHGAVLPPFTSAVEFVNGGPGCVAAPGDDSQIIALITEADRLGYPPGTQPSTSPTDVWGPRPLYWRCVPTILKVGDAPQLDRGQCVFLAPIRRLIPNPDTLQFVFWDDEDDWSNPARAFFWAARGIIELFTQTPLPINQFDDNGNPIIDDKGNQVTKDVSPDIVKQVTDTLAKYFCNYQRGDAHTRRFARPFSVFLYDDIQCPITFGECGNVWNASCPDVVIDGVTYHSFCDPTTCGQYDAGGSPVTKCSCRVNAFGRCGSMGGCAPTITLFDGFWKRTYDQYCDPGTCHWYLDEVGSPYVSCQCAIVN